VSGSCNTPDTRQPKMPERQLALIANLDTTEDAYRESIRGCRLSPASEAVAVWMLQAGEREMVDGCRCQVLAARTKAKLAAACGLTASSAYRGLRRLLELGLVVLRGQQWLLVLTRFCELSEARSTCSMDAGGTLGSGWSANVAAEKLDRRGPPGSPRFTLVHPGSGRFTPVQPVLRSEKEEILLPEFTETDTEPIGGAGEPLNQGEPDRTKVNQGEPARTAKAARPTALAKPADARAAMQSLNRTSAWQALQPSDFAGADGTSQPPAIEKLRACFKAAVASGVLRDHRDDKMQFLATAYDVAMHAGTKSPSGALVYRTANGRLHWAADNAAAYAWAKSIVDGRRAVQHVARGQMAPLNEILASLIPDT
jgi:hypothetical protein